MIELINGGRISITHFPDHTPHIDIDLPSSLNIVPKLSWHYESDTECMELYYIVNHMREHHFKDIELFMPYIPNARMDRVPRGSDDEVLTLKWFAHFLNDLHFSKVTVIDPHSNVAAALINNIYILDLDPFIQEAINYINSDNLTIFVPDEGAVKRLSLKEKTIPYLFGVKERDWKTHKLLNYKIIGDKALIADHDIFIIDDIFATGGTMALAVKALKELGARDIYAWATHCENHPNIQLPVKTLFTTTSIYNGFHKDIITRYL